MSSHHSLSSTAFIINTAESGFRCSPAGSRPPVRARQRCAAGRGAGAQGDRVRRIGTLTISLIGFNVAGEIVENGQPPSLLLFDGVRRFAVKSDANDDPFGARGELDLRHATARVIFDQLFSTIFGYVPAKSKPMLPSLASIRELKAPPSRKSTVAAVVCQSSDAAFHCLMSAGVA